MASPSKPFWIYLVSLLVSASLFATSARQIFPELVGVRAVWLNTNIFNFSGADVPELETAIRERLLKAGIATTESGPIHLFVKASYIESPNCSDMVAVQIHVALSENARVRRPGRNLDVWVDTWKQDQELLISKAEAWGRVRESILVTVDYLLDSREYTSSVVK